MVWDRAVRSPKGTQFVVIKEFEADGILLKKGEVISLQSYKETEYLSDCYAMFLVQNKEGVTVKLRGDDIEYQERIIWYVPCPYCGANMELTHFCDSVCYVCDDCSSESPAVFSEGKDHNDLYNEALSIALKRVAMR